MDLVKNFGFGSKVDDNPKMETAAQKKMNLLKGYQALWINSRRDNFWYRLNKIFSVAIGIVFAVITLSFKRTTQIFMLQEIKEN